MKSKNTNIASVLRQRPTIWSEIKLLIKLKLSLTVVFSSLMAYAITASTLSWLTAAILFTGGMLITSAANALNQVLEREFDALMDRTKNRPLASQRMRVATAVLIAGLSSVIGTLLLAWVHPLAGFLGMLSLVLYAFVYTPMKRFGPSAVFVGAIPGAIPVLIGTIIGSGDVTALGLILFGIQFFWQIPHFWAIAWMGHEDYTRAGFRLLPNANNQLLPSIGSHAMIQALFIIPLIGLGYFIQDFGIVSSIIVALVTLYYAALGWNLYRFPGRERARKLMFGSFVYLPVVLIVFFIETLI